MKTVTIKMSMASDNLPQIYLTGYPVQVLHWKLLLHRVAHGSKALNNQWVASDFASGKSFGGHKFATQREVIEHVVRVTPHLSERALRVASEALNINSLEGVIFKEFT